MGTTRDGDPTMFPARDTARGRLHAELVEATQRLTASSQRLAHTFAAGHGLHPTDLIALIHVMHAQARGRPLTAGQLGTALELGSGSVTAVIDRLVAEGHIERRRSPRDRRRIHLHYAPEGQRVATRFFTPLSRLADEVMNGFSVAELEVIGRFLEQMVTATDQAAEATRR